MVLLSEQFGWYNPIRIIMLLAFIFMVILGVYFLAKRNKKRNEMDSWNGNIWSDT